MTRKKDDKQRKLTASVRRANLLKQQSTRAIGVATPASRRPSLPQMPWDAPAKTSTDGATAVRQDAHTTSDKSHD